MKKLIAFSVASAIVLSMAVPTMADDGISVIVNGNKIDFADQTPIIKNDRTLVPLRGVLEKMGIEVSWDDTDKSVIASRGLSYSYFQIGSNDLFSDERNIQLDTAPEIINGRTMVPLRAIAEAFGADVSWDANTKTVTINDSNKVLDVTTKTFHKDYKNDEGVVLYSVDIESPVLNDNITAAGKDEINKAINLEQIFLDNESTITSDIDSSAKEIYAMPDREYNPLQLTIKYKVTYLSDSIISLYVDSMYNLGGAHPITNRDSKTFDLNTGKELTLSDFVKGDTAKSVKDSFEAVIKADPDKFYSNAFETYDDYKDYINFYLTDNGSDGYSVILYAPLYTIAPYAVWFVDIPLITE